MKKSKAGRKRIADEKKLVYIQGYCSQTEKAEFFEATEAQLTTPSKEIRKFVAGYNKAWKKKKKEE